MIQEVIDILQNILPVEVEYDAVMVSEDLSQFGLDSLNCIAVVIELEDKFAITVPKEKLGVDNIRNVKLICELIDSIREERE